MPAGHLIASCLLKAVSGRLALSIWVFTIVVILFGVHDLLFAVFAFGDLAAAVSD